MKRYVFADTKKLNKAQRMDLAMKTANEKLMLRLALDKLDDVAICVAQNPNATEKVFKTLIDTRGRNYSVMSNILSNENCDDTIIDYAFKRPDNMDILGSHVSKVLRHTHNVDIFKFFAESDDEYDRANVARSPNTPQDILEDLAYDPESYVRQTLVARGDVPTSIFEILMYDPHFEVRYSIYTNPHTPIEIIEDYLHSDQYIDDLAQNHLPPLDLLDRSDLSADDLDVMVNGLVDQLNDDVMHYSGARIIDKIARHPNTSDATLSTLVGLPDAIGSAALINPNASQELIQSYVDRIKRGYVDNMSIIRYALKVTDDIDFLRKYATDRFWQYRVSVASNTHTPADVLESLTSDRDSTVRSAAKQTLSQQNRKSSTPRKASTTGWEVSPYSIETYAEIADEMTPLIAKVMTDVGKPYKGTVNYSFDTNDYDTADVLTLTISSGSMPDTEVSVDAQQFLAYLTSDSSKNTCVKNAVEYLKRCIGQLQVQ